MASRPSELGRYDYQALARFRHLIRRFLVFSERAVRKAGLKPQQHQLLLAVKGLPVGAIPTVGSLAWQLQLRHHSVVELTIRMERQGLLRRIRNADDHRQVLVVLTPRGERVLGRLTRNHRDELRRAAPQLFPALIQIFALQSQNSVTTKKDDSPWPTPAHLWPLRRPTAPAKPDAFVISRQRRGSSRSRPSPS